MDILSGFGSTPGKFYIYHNGGDELKIGSFSILVDSGSGYEDKTADFVLEGGGDVWQSGGSLYYDYGASPRPLSVNLVFTGYGTETLLTSSSVYYNKTGEYSPSDTGTGDIIVPADTFSTPVEIIDTDELNAELESRLGEAVLVTEINQSFIPDRVHAVIYNYEDLGAGNRNAYAREMSLNTTLGSNVYEVMVDELNLILSASDLPTSISVTVIAYNATEGSFSNTALVEVKRNN